MYEVPSQAKFSKDWNSPTMVESAAEMIDTFIVASITDSLNEPKTNQSWRVENPGTMDAMTSLHRRSVEGRPESQNAGGEACAEEAVAKRMS